MSGPCSGNTVSWFGGLWSLSCLEQNLSWTPSLCCDYSFYKSLVACYQAILLLEITSQGAGSWTPPLPRERAWRSPRWRTGCLPSTAGCPERGAQAAALSGLHGAGERSGSAPREGLAAGDVLQHQVWDSRGKLQKGKQHQKPPCVEEYWPPSDVMS